LSESGTRTPRLSALTGAGVGVLGGLIGLGGAEFRLPLLVRVFGYVLKPAVFLNLTVSLVTVGAALAARLTFGVSLGALTTGLDVAAALAVGSVLGAYRGATWLAGVSEPRLHRAVKVPSVW
jgi:uncharacterized membrane protein YfcA